MSKDRFFGRMNRLGLALTYDDVRLIPDQSEIMPKDTILESRFARRTPLRIPIVSAAMDTITERKMGIAMAMFGGIGVIHRNLEPKQQASEVARVKHHLNAKIAKPITVFGDQTIGEIKKRRQDKGYSFQSFPVLDREEKVIGLLTRNDFSRCHNDLALARDVMTPLQKLETATAETNLDQAYERLIHMRHNALPLIDKDGRLAGMFIFTDVKRIKLDEASGYNLDMNSHLRVAAAIGTGEKELARAALLVQASVDALVIDTAHGDSKFVYETLAEVKKNWPYVDVVVGNVSTGAAAERLAKAGADGIKVGQGPGSICTSRIMAGIGIPQITAVYNCAAAIKKLGLDIPICADGGIKHPGDIPIAIGAGAHSVMLGNILAATHETPGEILIIGKHRWKIYRGMGSLEVLLESEASRDRYQQDLTSIEKIVPEGKKS
ncbi:IMP dehydrogenase, partial [Candidatus Parcubacteria bacterium]|nr:IMP dehydrogenase [Candidatus Parcubacteria bacterium]